ncbi:kinase-like domain-containing protein [Fusarium tricinctum]|uniref:Kinase-like domain-containing protein n=1 Tax=Fusarium tricinctum TaxID=61284 RepID=A0A8K0RP35_9HYPO|nr:kinase-like domain-containing protein [Fusarium tricinctum]
MERPSDSWSDLTSLDQDSEKYKQIHTIISLADFCYLEKRGLEARTHIHPALSANIKCSINTSRFNLGFHNLVLELSFTDNIYWIARIPYKGFKDDDRTSMLSEIATMKIVKKHTKLPIPQVFDFEASANQAFGYPYILLEYLGGRTPKDLLVRSIPLVYHEKVAKQLAEVFAELQNLTFSRIGRLWCGEDAEQPIEIIGMAWHASPGPLETSFEYFYNQRQSENREAATAHEDDPDWLTACWVLKLSLCQIIVEDRARGPFPLCHLDLHYGNMLLDDEYNLKAVIDWSNAQAAPLEQLSVCPEFSISPALSDEQNKPARELKASVVRHLKDTESAQESKVTLNSLDKDGASSLHLTRLSDYLASRSSELALRQYLSSPVSLMLDSKGMAQLLYGDVITWEQLKDIYDWGGDGNCDIILVDSSQKFKVVDVWLNGSPFREGWNRTHKPNPESAADVQRKNE